MFVWDRAILCGGYLFQGLGMSHTWHPETEIHHLAVLETKDHNQAFSGLSSLKTPGEKLSLACFRFCWFQALLGLWRYCSNLCFPGQLQLDLKHFQIPRWSSLKILTLTSILMTPPQKKTVIFIDSGGKSRDIYFSSSTHYNCQGIHLFPLLQVFFHLSQCIFQLSSWWDKVKNYHHYWIPIVFQTCVKIIL